MDYNMLIGLSLDQAVNILNAESKKYIIKKLGTFKLKTYDACAVVKVSVSGDTLILYACDFMCKKQQ